MPPPSTRIVASGECCAVSADGKVDVEQAGVHPGRHPRRPRQRGSRRRLGFRAARHRAPERRRLPLQFGRGEGGRIGPDLPRGGCRCGDSPCWSRSAMLVAAAALAARAARTDRAGLARLQGRRGDAAAQRLAHRAGRPPHHRRRSADEPRPVARRPLPRDLDQRLREAGASASSTRRTCRSSAASKSITPGSAWSGIRTASGCSPRASSENVDLRVHLPGGRLTAAGSISLGPAEAHPGRDVIANAGYVAGMDAQRRRRASLRRRRSTARRSAPSISQTARSSRPRSSTPSRTPACCRPTARRCSSRCGAARRS